MFVAVAKEKHLGANRDVAYFPQLKIKLRIILIKNNIKN